MMAPVLVVGTTALMLTVALGNEASDDCAKHGADNASAKPAAAIRRAAALLENKVITILLLLTARRQITMKRSRANTAVDSQQGGRIPWFQVIVNSVIGFGSSRLGFHRLEARSPRS